MSKNIVILGAGYGGLTTAIKLQKKLRPNEATVTLINAEYRHCLSTSLHKLAAGSVEQDYCEVDILKLLKDKKIHFLKASVESINIKEQFINFTTGLSIPYDYLVMALGSEPETFGIPGLQEYALSIRSIPTAQMIKDHIDKMFANYKKDPKPHYLTFVIGGSGFTGIQFTGELIDQIPILCKKHRIDPKLVKIYNIEAAPDILPGFHPKLVSFAKDVLESKGVVFKTNSPIKEYKDEQVILSNHESIKTASLIWTGGVRGNSLLERCGLEAKRGRVLVNDHLRVPLYENLYIVGDGSLFLKKENNTPLPPTAQMAVQQAHTCAENLIAQIRKEQARPFTPITKGTLVSLGKKDAAGVVLGYPLKGSPVRLLKKLIDLYYLYSIGGISLASKNIRFAKSLKPSED